MYRTKVFSADKPDDLENKMNSFFGRNPKIVIHQMTQAGHGYPGCDKTTVVVVYTEEPNTVN